MKTARKISMELGKMVGGRGRSYQVRATLLGGIYDEEKVHTERSLSWGASRTCHSLGPVQRGQAPLPAGKSTEIEGLPKPRL